MDDIQATGPSAPLCAATITSPLPGREQWRTVFQILRVEGRDFAWIDGVDSARPMLAPLDQLRHVRPLGWAEEFFALNLTHFTQLVMAGDLGAASPGVLARAVIEIMFGVPAHGAMRAAMTRSTHLASAFRRAG